MDQSKQKVRLTISITRQIAQQIDSLVDGLKIRNRSHAVESLLAEALNISSVQKAVILAGGEDATKRIPAIKHCIQLFQYFGIIEMTMVVGFLGESIKQEFGNGEALGVKINYIQSELGTGGAIKSLKANFQQPFFVANLDQPANLDLKNLIRFHRQQEPIATIAIRSLDDLTGIYLFEPKIFTFIPAGFCMLEDDVFHQLIKQGKLLPYPVLTPLPHAS